jgi:hemoglobin
MNTYRSSIMVAIVLAISAGCGSAERKDREYFTSGSREADQRAEQRMAREQQLKGKAGGTNAPQAVEKKTLYDRRGGEKGIAAIVDDFVQRAIADPRVNWQRKGVKYGGLLIHRDRSMEWIASDEHVAQLKKHLAQFFSLATGGPITYEGKQMRPAHQNMHINNPEFDAAVGDMKATLDKLGIPNQEQKELMSIVESARPEVVEER